MSNALIYDDIRTVSKIWQNIRNILINLPPWGRTISNVTDVYLLFMILLFYYRYVIPYLLDYRVPVCKRVPRSSQYLITLLFPFSKVVLLVVIQSIRWLSMASGLTSSRLHWNVSSETCSPLYDSTHFFSQFVPFLAYQGVRFQINAKSCIQ